MKDALTKRKQLKARKPVFLAQDTHKKKRIRQRWRRPRGLQSKIRLNKRGYRRGVSSGWRSPRQVRGLSPEGLVPIRVETIAQLETIDPKTQGAIVSGRVSIRTKKALYDAAAQRSITVLNRDAATFEERYVQKLAERDARKKRLESKRKRQEKLKKDIEKTEKSGVAAEGLKAPKKPTDADAKKAASSDTPSETSSSDRDEEKASKSPSASTPAQAPEIESDADTKQASEAKKDASEPKEGSR